LYYHYADVIDIFRLFCCYAHAAMMLLRRQPPLTMSHMPLHTYALLDGHYFFFFFDKVPLFFMAAFAFSFCLLRFPSLRLLLRLPRQAHSITPDTPER